MNIKHLELMKEKALKEYQTLDNNNYKLSDHHKYIQDTKRLEYLKGQISLYDSIIVDLKENLN